MRCSPNVATAIGPVIGGVLVEHPGWRWIFWLLAISSGLCLLLMALLLPETCRFIVGSGSFEVSGIHCSILSHMRRLGQPLDAEKRIDEHGVTPPRKRFKIPNPLRSLKILLKKDTILITLIYGVYYTNFSCLQASLSTLFIQIYKVSELQAGLVYLPFGVGSCAGAYFSGMVSQSRFFVLHSAPNALI
jgi:predicted MFS family arabinose efflux permease